MRDFNLIGFIVWIASVLLLGIWIGITVSRRWLWKDEIETAEKNEKI